MLTGALGYCIVGSTFSIIPIGHSGKIRNGRRGATHPARLPSASWWTARINQLAAGTPVSRLVTEFLGTAEYAARFD